MSGRSVTGAGSKGDGGLEEVDVLVLLVGSVAKDEVFEGFDDFLLLPRAILPHSRGQQEDQPKMHKKEFLRPIFDYKIACAKKDLRMSSKQCKHAIYDKWGSCPSGEEEVLADSQSGTDSHHGTRNKRLIVGIIL